MAQWREKVTLPKKAGKLEVSFRIIQHYAPINVMPAGGEAGHRVGI